MKRCLIFNPYYAVLGGGERYTAALGSVISETHDVTYASPVPADLELAARLGFPPITVEQRQLEDLPGLSLEYDLVVVVTLTIPPPSFANRSLLVVQFPRDVASVGGRAARVTARVLRRYRCVVYSEFVRTSLRERWHVDGDVLMPGVTLAGRQTPKEKLILSVGRFMANEESQWNSKRHDVLVDAFAQLPAHLRDSWQLVLAGGGAESPELHAYVAELQHRVSGLNVSFELNVPADRLADLQARARFFWHASGYGRAPTAQESAEHFGMSTCEAMSNGAIPLVYADGGQLEIVSEEFGRLWHTVPELVEQTAELMQRSTADLDAMGAAARAASTRFGSPRFEAEARALVARLGGRRFGDGRVGHAVARFRRFAARDVFRASGRFDRTASRLYRKVFRA